MRSLRKFPLALATLLTVQVIAAPADAANHDNAATIAQAAPSADAPPPAASPNAAPAATGPVLILYDHPENFRDVGDRFPGGAIARANLASLDQYFTRRAAGVLGPGEQLRITVTDVDLAGEFEYRRRIIRVLRDVYPPRIDLSFTLLDANGAVLKQGERKLRDAGFLFGATPRYSDSLRFEKALFDGWLEREFKPLP
jgi:hypothetical protein